jgi:hypothetical protein
MFLGCSTPSSRTAPYDLIELFRAGSSSCFALARSQGSLDENDAGNILTESAADRIHQHLFCNFLAGSRAALVSNADAVDRNFLNLEHSRRDRSLTSS